MGAPFSVTEAMVAWLSDMGYPTSTRAPQGATGPFLTVERVGGSVRGMVDHATVAVQVWAPTEDRAEAIANATRLELVTSRPPAGVHSVRVNAGPYPFPDEATRTPRYQLALDVSCQLTI